jgi:FkbH-like protein
VSALERRLAWRKVLAARDGDVPVRRVAVLSTFTAQPAEPFLGMAFEDAKIPALIWTGPYDQIVSECVSPSSETAAFLPDVVVVWPRLEDVWRGLDAPLVDSLERFADALIETVEPAIEAARRWQATLVVVLPAMPELRPLGVGDASNPLGVGAAAEWARFSLRQRLAEQGVLVADAEVALRRIGADAALDPRTQTTSRVPYTPSLFADVAAQIATLIRIQRVGAVKVAVVDADNTLWGGVVGEDGPDGIDLLDNGPGEAFRAFQRYLVELRRAGMLIAVASKNNEADLWPAFDRREMVLRREHLAAWRVNWDPKPSNLVEMADELNLGLSSFVFIDDNPVELGAVADALPDVRCLQMPTDSSLWQRSITEAGLFDRLPPTAEDLGRAEGYRVEQTRRELSAAMTPEEYRASLAVEVDVFAPSAADMGRLAQLVAKTNQFTLGGVRHTEPELASMIADPHIDVRLVSAKDRFGDYGIVGATIVRSPEAGSVADGSGAPALDTFVLSCRAMGRGVEEAMLSDAVTVAGGVLAVSVVETAKNVPARRFFATFGIDPGTTFVLADVPWPKSVQRNPR